jgi:hypothetical protein
MHQTDPEPMTWTDQHNTTPHQSTSHLSNNDLAVGKWILQLKEDKKLSEATTNDVMKVTRELFSVLLEETKEKIILDMAQQGVPKEMQDAIIPSTSNHTELMVFDQLDSAYKRKEFFLKHFNLVECKKVTLGSHVKWRGTGRKRTLKTVKDTFVYVPVLESLQNLLKIDGVFEEVCNSHQNKDGYLEDLCDGTMTKKHPLFGQDLTALQICLYYDDVEMCNPLGSKKTVHKLGFFYYNIGNIHPRHRSNLSSIHLVAITNRSHIKKYGMNTILQPLVNDIKKLVSLFACIHKTYTYTCVKA